MIKGLPERLKELRARYGYSQKDVAKKINLSPSVISGYETGERTPSVDILLQLAYIYHCRTDYLLGKSEEEEVIMIEKKGMNDVQIQALIQIAKVLKE